MNAENLREKMRQMRVKRYELAAELNVRPETISVWLDEARQWDLIVMDKAIDTIVSQRMEVLG